MRYSSVRHTEAQVGKQVRAEAAKACGGAEAPESWHPCHLLPRSNDRASAEQSPTAVLSTASILNNTQAKHDTGGLLHNVSREKEAVGRQAEKRLAEGLATVNTDAA